MLLHWIQQIVRPVPFAALLSLALLPACSLSEDPAELQPPSATALDDDDAGGPRARILLPNDDQVTVGPPRVHFRWDGLDQAGGVSAHAGRPAGFEYKLVEIDGIGDHHIREALASGANLFLSNAPDPSAWVQVPPVIRDRSFDIGPDTPSLLAFAVRAIDGEGVPEPELDYRRNLATMSTTDTPPKVRLEVIDIATARNASFDEFTTRWELNVPPETDLQLVWQVDASGHGAPPGPTDYALDLVDPDVEGENAPGGIGGWIGWDRRDGLDVPLRFSREEAGTEHVLFLRARDAFEAPENELRVRIDIRVEPVALDRFALLVDDTKFVGPNDATHDAYVEEVVAARLGELGPIDVLDIYGDPEGSSPRPVSIEQLGRYRVVLWHVGAGSGPNSGLGRSQEALSSYLASGGRVFFVGGQLSSLTLASFSYPKEPASDEGEGDFDANSFIWRHLRYEDDVVGVPTNESRRVQEGSGLIGCRSLWAGFPTLTLDPLKWDPWMEEDGSYHGGIRDWEGVLVTTPPRVPPAGFEAIYAPDTFDHSLCCGDVTPRYEGSIIGHRYESPLAPGQVGYQGRTVVFNFQPWYFETEAVTEACRQAIDWLVEDLDTPGGRLGRVEGGLATR